MNECILCEQVPAEAAEVYRDAWWAAGIFPGLEVPGWYVLRLLRHGEGLESMTGDEATALGPLLQNLSRAMGEVCSTDVVYATCYGETNRHLHWLLMARTSDIPAEQRLGRLAEQATRLADPDRALSTAARIHHELIGTSS